MKTNVRICPPSGRGFSLVELLVVVMIIAILAGMLLPALARAKGKTQRINCANNLKQVGLAFRVFSVDNADQFPMQIPANRGGSRDYAAGGNAFRHFQVLSNELATPNILVCPADDRAPAPDFLRLANENLSYFVGLTATEIMPQSLLSGDRNLTINQVPVKTGVVSLTTNTVVGWSAAMHGHFGNVGLGDGSVQQFSEGRFRAHLADSGFVTNNLAIP